MLNPTAPGEIIFLSILFNKGSGPGQDECQLKRNKVYLEDDCTSQVRFSLKLTA